MWRRQIVAVILPTYREKKSIFRAIQDFDSSGYIDEIIVVDNNAEVGTEAEVKKTRAHLVKETRQGYGRAIRTGIEHTKADLLIVAEPDGTFDGKDVVKLLAYSDQFDIVFGARTFVPLIQRRAEMPFQRRILDVLLGKLINLLFLHNPMSDVGCSYRLFKRRGWNQVKAEAKADNAMFATEVQLIAAKNRLRYIEVPVNFRQRIGRSSLTATFYDQAKWGIRVFIYIWKVWIYHRLGKKLYGHKNS